MQAVHVQCPSSSFYLRVFALKLFVQVLLYCLISKSLPKPSMEYNKVTALRVSPQSMVEGKKAGYKWI